MVHHRDERDVPFSPDAMFELVATVTDYPRFIPWCEGLRIRHQTMRGGRDILLTEMIARYKVFTERLTSEVTLDRENGRITACYVDGPLSSLRTFWRFAANGKGGTSLTFEVDFEFKNRLVQSAAAYAFEDVFRKMADAFIARAAALYGQAA